MATSSGTGQRTGRTFTVDQEMIPVPSFSTRPDPTWRWTDPHGHEHLALFIERTSTLFPVGTWWCEDCNEEHTDFKRFCDLCLEAGVDTPVEPGMTGSSMIMEYIPGMTSYAIDGVPVDEATFNHELEKER